MEIPRHWRLKRQRYNLIGNIGPNGEPQFPPRPISLPPNKNQTAKVKDGELETKSHEVVIYSARIVSMSDE